MGDLMKTPKYDQPPLDPSFARLSAQTETDKIAAIHDRVEGDTASLLSRYGTSLALANSVAGSPLMTPAMPEGG